MTKEEFKSFDYPKVPKSTWWYYYTACDWCSNIYKIPWWRLLTPIAIECPHCRNKTKLTRDVRVIHTPINKKTQ